MATIGIVTIAGPAMSAVIPSAVPMPPVTIAALCGASVVGAGVALVTAVALLLLVRALVSRRPTVRRVEHRSLRLAA